MIFYFSGTGNTRWVAERICRLLDDRLYSIADWYTDMQTQDIQPVFTFEPDEQIGFIFPVYSWGPPAIVLSFIEKMKWNGYNGNYTYKDVEEIKIEGLAEMYSNNSYNGEVLEIDPVITSNYTDLTYEWYMWSIDKEGEGSSNWDENEEPYKAELISTDKKLSYPVECPIGLYTLMLKVTSSSNGYFAMATTRFDAQTVFTRGFYILKETKDGNSTKKIICCFKN